MAIRRLMLLLGVLLCWGLAAVPAGAQETPTYVNVPGPRLNPVDIGASQSVQPVGGVLGSQSVQPVGGVLGASGVAGGPGVSAGAPLRSTVGQVSGVSGVSRSTGLAFTGGDVLGLLGIAALSVFVGVVILRAGRNRSTVEPR